MKLIPPENYDPDCRAFILEFDEPPNSSVLAVGSNEEDTANLLHDAGYKVIAYDLREPRLCETPKYIRHQRDFVADISYPFETFDCAYSLSAIEHFGLSVYGGVQDLNYDAWAMDRLWYMVKKGGHAYVSVPVAEKDWLCGMPDGSTHWRVYGPESLQNRIVRLWTVEKRLYYKAHPDCPGVKGWIEWNGIERLIQEQADSYCGNPPHVSVLLKLRKGK